MLLKQSEPAAEETTAGATLVHAWVTAAARKCAVESRSHPETFGSNPGATEA